ncbi:MAG: hypothetical protein Q8936_21685 [Bacillota bacterium]|nr:hypothetical protein [Bacillota bacterium]
MFKTMFGISYESFKLLATSITIGYGFIAIAKDNDKVKEFISKHSTAVIIAIGTVFALIMYAI